jgi:hypothetical protein
MPLPSEIAYNLWHESLIKSWLLLKAATSQTQFSLVHFPECIKFADTLGVCKSDEEAFVVMKSDPKTAFSFLHYAQKVDDLYKQNKDAIQLTIGDDGNKVAPFQILAMLTSNELTKRLERGLS